MTNSDLNILCLNFSNLLQGTVEQICRKLTTEDINIINDFLFVGFPVIFGFSPPPLLD